MTQAQQNAPEDKTASPDSNRNQPPLILIADDDRVMRMMLQVRVEEHGYRTVVVNDGKEAWDYIHENGANITTILLDRQMPEMDGLDVVALMKQDRALARIPIIMATGSDSPEEIREGIDAGVFYYLTKPVNQDILSSVLEAAVRERKQQLTLRSELQQHVASFNLITKCAFEFKSLDEVQQLSTFLANCYPSPERVISGIAELLINALEHGNLGISYDEKTQLVGSGTWESEIIRRTDLPEYVEKKIEVMYVKDGRGYHLRIRDEGKGFNWQRYLTVDPARASDNHGRGIAQANAMSFDKLVYNDKGNEVMTFVKHGSEIDW